MKMYDMGKEKSFGATLPNTFNIIQRRILILKSKVFERTPPFILQLLRANIKQKGTN